MAYTYINKKTGEKVVTSNKISGKNWEEVKPKKGSAKKGTEQQADDAE